MAGWTNSSAGSRPANVPAWAPPAASVPAWERLPEHRGSRVVQRAEDELPDGGGVPGGRGFDRGAARGSEHDERAPAIAGTFFPEDEPAAGHPGQLVGEPALLPVQGTAELERAEPLTGRLAEMHEHVVLRQRQPRIGLQLPVQPGGQQRSARR